MFQSNPRILKRQKRNTALLTWNPFTCQEDPFPLSIRKRCTKECSLTIPSPPPQPSRPFLLLLSPEAVIWDASLSLFLPRALGLSSRDGLLRIHQLVYNGHKEALNVKRYDFSFFYFLSPTYVSRIRVFLGIGGSHHTTSRTCVGTFCRRSSFVYTSSLTV